MELYPFPIQPIKGNNCGLIPNVATVQPDTVMHWNTFHKKLNCILTLTMLYVENINLILAFIINIISQPIELLKLSSSFIV